MNSTPNLPDSNQPVPATPNPQPVAQPAPHSQLSTLNSQLTFPLLPGETPCAFAAFMAYFQFGQARSLQAVADHLDESLGCLKRWSAKYHWNDRIQSFNSGLLEQQLKDQADARRQQAADWACRSNAYREQKWDTAQHLLHAVQCFLQNFGDREVEKMSLGQVARALQISSRLAAEALSAPGPKEPDLEFLEALRRVYPETSPAPESLAPDSPPADPSSVAVQLRGTGALAKAGQLTTSE